VRRLADEQEPRVVDFCQRLVRVRSLPGEEGEAAQLIQREMQALDLRRDVD
jgi:hypothetical protein